jgi:Cof subfamily protein (haloacid dehalogenase superfamily)
MTYRLIFVDVDGTLANSQREVTPKTLTALQHARGAGARVALATGRTFESAQPFAHRIGANAPLILYNGAQIHAAETGSVLHRWTLESEQIKTVLRVVEGSDVHISLFQEDGIYIEDWNERARRQAHKDSVDFVPTGDLTSRLEHISIKLMLISEPAVLDGLEVEMRSAFAEGGAPMPAIVRSEDNLLEVWNAATSKGTAAQWVAHELGIAPSEVIAFGDNLNDTELLKFAGMGVAMENAHAALKACADRVTTSNDADGIAVVLNEVFGS